MLSVPAEHDAPINDLLLSRQLIKTSIGEIAGGRNTYTHMYSYNIIGHYCNTQSR